ncbi:MAG: PAS domain S-box protein [Acidobacteria bacterium]|nr:PAS domain S-box protein [Acidobacteriota bacterium]
MASIAGTDIDRQDRDPDSSANPKDAALLLQEATAAFRKRGSGTDAMDETPPETLASSIEAKYRALLEQIPAVVFMAYMDRGTSEAYVSPEIEATLGYSRDEWLNDPMRWYDRIHPDDKQRWSVETAEMFLSGKPLRSSYRVLSQSGRTVWFRCDARMERRPDGKPWFIHGVAFDISDLKETERALQQERNFISGILETVGALITVLDEDGRILRFNRTCEVTTGYKFEEVRGRYITEFLALPEEVARAHSVIEQLREGSLSIDCKSHWVTRDGATRLIAWSSMSLAESDGQPRCIIATGIDITEREHLERALLDVSAREQRRIGQDLHDGLGQHLTGIAFMAKVHEKKLSETDPVAAAETGKLVRLVNEAVHKTRELARGLLPVMSDTQGLMSALQMWADEVEDIYGVSCDFECTSPVLIRDITTSTHLYHIAQEAVNNAIKHGSAKNILIRLSIEGDLGRLQIVDDGKGIPEKQQNSRGMGLHIMTYRSAMIGGRVDISRNAERGTTVACMFPIKQQ